MVTMQVNQEIERKFLVKRPPTASPDKFHVMTTHYLSVGDVEVRIAYFEQEVFLDTEPIPGTYELTMKQGKGISRREVIIPVMDEVGEGLVKMADPTKRIHRTRFWYEGGWEVDHYHDRLWPLLVAEIELPKEDSLLPPLPTGLVLGAEVTHVAEFKNKALYGLTDRQIHTLYYDHIYSECDSVLTGRKLG